MKLQVKDIIAIMGDYERVDIISSKDPITFASIELGARGQEPNNITLKSDISYDELCEDIVNEIDIGNYEVDHALLVYIDRSDIKDDESQGCSS